MKVGVRSSDSQSFKRGVTAIEQCKDCLYQVTVTRRIDKLETEVDELKKEVQGIHTSVELQKQSTETILGILSELKTSVKSVETILSNRTDLFKETMYELGVFAIKFGVVVGGISAGIYAIVSKVRGV